MATFVLVPGSYHGGRCWKKVTPLLTNHGHRVYTPTLTGLGERSHLLREDIDLNTHILDII
jgi:Alpha/beta hydrolase family